MRSHRRDRRSYGAETDTRAQGGEVVDLGWVFDVLAQVVWSEIRPDYLGDGAVTGQVERLARVVAGRDSDKGELAVLHRLRAKSYRFEKQRSDGHRRDAVDNSAHALRYPPSTWRM